MKNLILLNLLSLISFVSNAQSVEMAETMRSEGKIYVVIAVLVTILLGLFIYLITIDRKVAKLEQLLKS